MSAKRPPGGDGLPPSPSDTRSSGITTTATTVLVLSTVALLMVFSVVLWLLDNTTLAALAGTAACTLAVDLIRRLLGFAVARSAGDDDQGRAGREPGTASG